ncbi:MAG: hypothetical protein JWO93_2916 [Micrococcaceae bacterium]|jgi:putative peptidoglycan lipid II flippase|nr:hypothetical protein [Micrococcaceae bacterium]
MANSDAAPAPGTSGTAPATAARSSASMAVATLVSRILGFTKGIFLGIAVGGTVVADIFDTANNLPNIIYLLVAGGVFNVVLVPQIIKASKQPDRGSDFISRLLTLAVLALLLLTVIITAAAGPLMFLLTSGFSPAKLALTTAFATLLLPQIFFYGLYSLLGQVLNAHGAFRAYAWAPVVNNIVAIAGLVTFILIAGNSRDVSHTVENWSSGQTALLAGSATLGIVLQSLTLLWPLRKLGLELRPRFGWRGFGFQATGRIAAWTMGTMVLGNLTFLLIGKIATIATGAKTDGTIPQGGNIPGPYDLSRATELYILPHSVIALSIATVLFTRMAAAAADKDHDRLREALSRGLRTIGVATVFGAAALLVLCGQFGMLFSSSSRETAMNIAVTLAILAVGSPFLSANFLMNRVFYAAENARTPFRIQVILIVVGISTAMLASLLPPRLIIFGLAASYTVGNMVAVLVTHFFLKAQLGHYGAARIAVAHLRFAAAAVICAAAGMGVLWLLGGFDHTGFAWRGLVSAAVTLAAAGTVMAVIYFAALRLLRVPELQDLLEPLSARLRGRVPGLR